MAKKKPAARNTKKKPAAAKAAAAATPRRGCSSDDLEGLTRALKPWVTLSDISELLLQKKTLKVEMRHYRIPQTSKIKSGVGPLTFFHH